MLPPGGKKWQCIQVCPDNAKSIIYTQPDWSSWLPFLATADIFSVVRSHITLLYILFTFFNVQKVLHLVLLFRCWESAHATLQNRTLWRSQMAWLWTGLRCTMRALDRLQTWFLPLQDNFYPWRWMIQKPVSSAPSASSVEVLQHAPTHDWSVIKRKGL